MCKKYWNVLPEDWYDDIAPLLLSSFLLLVTGLLSLLESIVVVVVDDDVIVCEWFCCGNDVKLANGEYDVG